MTVSSHTKVAQEEALYEVLCVDEGSCTQHRLPAYAEGLCTCVRSPSSITVISPAANPRASESISTCSGVGSSGSFKVFPFRRDQDLDHRSSR